MAHRTRRPRGLSANHVNEEERLHTIMTDKSTLSSVRLLGKENWVKMEERPNCFYCARKFRPFSLKRHCRSCGEIVCSNCYRRRKVSVTPTLEVTVRLCFDCIDKAMLLAESEIINASTPVIENSQSSKVEVEVQDIVQIESKPDVKKTFRDSVQTTSTSTSVCSRFSDFSSCDNWSDVSSDRSDNSSLAGSGGPIPPSQRGSRRAVPIIPATDVIEFLPEDEQFEIYEGRRHEILARFKVLDTEPEKEYDALCELVRQVMECSVAAVAFMDQTRQWYKARYGIAQNELPREISFCSQLLQTPLPTIIMDASKDPRFIENPLVKGSANIRFYATTPICDPDTGIVIGSVFVMDPIPKTKLPLRAMEVLSYVSSAAEKLLQGKGPSPIPPSVKQKRNSSASRRESMPPLPEIRAASLQSVPEEVDDGDFRVTQPRSNASSVSSSSSLRSSQHGSLRRSGPKPPLPTSSSHSSSSSASSKSSNLSTSKLRITDLVSSDPKSGTASQQSLPTEYQSLDSSCIEIFNRITSTQQLLAQQHDTLLATLTQHTTRISSIEQTVDRIEDILSTQRAQYMPQLVQASSRRPMDM
ncbi:1-phosphatidylinositol 3-phosphate 5-kinase FAB1 [Phytophthora cinnamomi]|uniref:1-phosphatidylinositol 3-phosphate 5-kinase FAB1 n=1 Tax=Phytophthora cinnamomi TaxID=4785 RepID=UPI00355987EF|nr:1-phosphatidylinositol 3-phosphate 5-kinase FAB1 [Phytophthora cinnamomi]